MDEIYDIITSDNELTKLTISPLKKAEFYELYPSLAAEPGPRPPFLYEPLEHEILIFKDTYLQIFVQSYQRQDLRGLLLTTNDNHNLMKQITVRGTEEELKYVCCLLGCSRNKINKSSLLWLYLKKIIVKAQSKSILKSMIIDTVILSATRHLSNYYCWEFMRFYVVYAMTQTETILLDTNDITRIVEYCLANLKDSSSWSFLAYYHGLTNGQGQGQDDYYYSQYVRICQEFDTINPVAKKDLDISQLPKLPQFTIPEHSTSQVPYILYLADPSLVPAGFFDDLDEYNGNEQEQEQEQEEQDAVIQQTKKIQRNKRYLSNWLSMMSNKHSNKTTV